MSKDYAQKTSVAIVGGGPVGLLLAMFLDQHGVHCTVFNTESSARMHPKGSTHNSRTMEHYRRLGFSKRVRDLGLPLDHPTDVAYFTRFNEWELARLTMPSETEKRQHVAASRSTDQVPEPIHRANQMYVERVLLEEASKRPCITLKFGTKVVAVQEESDGVLLDAADTTTEELSTWKASYLVGCDGGRSFVRSALGITYEGFENLRQAFFGGRMVSTYLRAPTLYRDYLHGKRAWQYWIVNPKLRTALVPLNGDDEFLLWTRDDKPDSAIDQAAITEVLRQCTGADLPVQVLAHAKWTAGVALVAEKFARGRILLAGDAVHLFTPTGGFGMNTGADDAANLAWKLAAVVQGWGGRNLLASYELERKPIAQRNTAAARELARNIGLVPVPSELDQDSHEGERARAETGAFLSTFGEEYASLGVQLGARYDDSPIIVKNGNPPPDDPANYVPSSVPGGRAPHFWLDDGRGDGSSLYDHLGLGFTLLCLNNEGHDTDALRHTAQTRGIPLKILCLDNSPALEMYGVSYVLIRPDQHICWRGDTLPEDVDTLLDIVTGAR
ncbi:MAG: FAD-dependent oxidoreductase [Burkholderiaceae bacterium]